MYAGDPTGGVPELQQKGKENKGNKPGRNFSMAPRNIQMAAMDSPVFECVLFYFLLNNMYGEH